MLFWAVVSDSTEEAVELFTSREEAEAVVQAGTEMSRDKRGACASRRSSSRLRRTNQPAAAIVATSEPGHNNAEEKPVRPFPPAGGSAWVSPLVLFGVPAEVAVLAAVNEKPIEEGGIRFEIVKRGARGQGIALITPVDLGEGIERHLGHVAPEGDTRCPAAVNQDLASSRLRPSPRLEYLLRPCLYGGVRIVRPLGGEGGEENRDRDGDRKNHSPGPFAGKRPPKAALDRGRKASPCARLLHGDRFLRRRVVVDEKLPYHGGASDRVHGLHRSLPPIPQACPPRPDASRSLRQQDQQHKQYCP